MTEDRRYLHDPFAPPPASLTGAVQPPEPDPEADPDQLTIDTGDPQDGAQPVQDDGLEDLTKAELIELLPEGAPTSGTKAELIARVRAGL